MREANWRDHGPVSCTPPVMRPIDPSAACGTHQTASLATTTPTRTSVGPHRSAISTRKGGGFHRYELHTAVCTGNAWRWAGPFRGPGLEVRDDAGYVPSGGVARGAGKGPRR